MSEVIAWRQTDASELSACVIVFVCTGNTCRSPLAEAFCKKLLAEQLSCTIEELPQRGFIVLSAGLSVMMGTGAAPESVEAGHELGIDLTGHRSRPLTMELAEQADYIIGMTQSHLRALEGLCRQHGPALCLLDGGGEDVLDPIGCDLEIYRECARQIESHVRKLVGELKPSN
jgi:L-threonylcarbamoyladenylate synthase